MNKVNKQYKTNLIKSGISYYYIVKFNIFNFVYYAEIC